ncbi:hypothetical protein [Streptomyces sp. NPDC048192]|uniref:hypothetical protein n=1 Tax=Streptomyces sp. NPDC048192 TaxID=3365510 RepID=UPI003711EA91
MFGRRQAHRQPGGGRKERCVHLHAHRERQAAVLIARQVKEAAIPPGLDDHG